MEEGDRDWFVGVDWASPTHQVFVIDAQGRKLGERGFAHSGEGLAEMAAWIEKQTGAAPDAVSVAIEVSHGPVVESLMERGFRVHSINPKQFERFRDRFPPAGAKDDSRDAHVLADALRTDPRCLRRLEPLDPVIAELRERSRIGDDLRQDRNRLGKRVRELLKLEVYPACQSQDAGREPPSRPQGEPEEVRVHDALVKKLGRVIPDGICDLANNAGWGNVGMDHDTAAFAVKAIRRWWAEVGRARSLAAKRLVITAGGGGASGSRVRLWKAELQTLATAPGIDIEVHHLPPGTGRWNRIEHELFWLIGMNWRARSLVSYQVIVSLIGATTTTSDLTVRRERDEAKYPKGVVVTEQQMDTLAIIRDTSHMERNYAIEPQIQAAIAVIC